jgi:hypothetical protein
VEATAAKLLARGRQGAKYPKAIENFVKDPKEFEMNVLKLKDTSAALEDVKAADENASGPCWRRVGPPSLPPSFPSGVPEHRAASGHLRLTPRPFMADRASRCLVAGCRWRCTSLTVQNSLSSSPASRAKEPFWT